MSNDEFVNPEDRYMTNLLDPIIMSITNLDHEVVVGDALLTYVNPSQIFMSDPQDRTIRDEIKRVNDGRVFTSEQVPTGVTWGQTDEIESLIFGWCKCNIQIERLGCGKVRIFGSCKDALWGNGDGTISIRFFANGSIPPSFTTHREDGNFEFFFDVSNFTTDVVFEFSADPDCFAGSLEEGTLVLDPEQSICDSHNRSTDWDWKQDNGSQAISIRTCYQKGIWAGYEQAHLFSYHNNGETWNNVKGKLTVSVDAIRRDKACFPVGPPEDETNSCKNCKDISASVNNSKKWHCDGDVNGTFRKDLNWQGQSWSINAAQSVDFECCVE